MIRFSQSPKNAGHGFGMPYGVGSSAYVTGTPAVGKRLVM